MLNNKLDAIARAVEHARWTTDLINGDCGGDCVSKVHLWRQSYPNITVPASL